MHKIAVIEGDIFLRQLYVLKLRGGQLNTRSAGDGHEGFKLLRRFKPDLVVMDVKLAGLSGIEVMEKYLRHHDSNNPKLIMASNYDESVARSMFSHLDVDKYIVKAHHTPAELLSIVKDLLGLQAGFRETTKTY